MKKIIQMNDKKTKINWKYITYGKLPIKSYK